MAKRVLVEHKAHQIFQKRTFHHLKPFVYHSYKENTKWRIVNSMQFYLGERNWKVDKIVDYKRYDRRIYNCSDLKLDLYCYIYETLWN